MKKLIFGLTATVLLSLNVNAQRPSLSSLPCGTNQHAVISYEFNCLRLHRASTDCVKRFSICSDGEWVIECIQNGLSKLSKYNPEKNLASVVGEVSQDGKFVTLHFPLEIMKSAGFIADDFKNFGFDDDHRLNKDFVIRKGEYIPTLTKDEILVMVTLK